MSGGRIIGGRYELIELVGQGSMGAVWRARDLKTDATVAVKLLHSFLETERDVVRRFEREGRIDVRSPHVVRTSDAGRDGGELYIVMEYVEGDSLRTLLQAGPLPPERAGAITAQIAAALAAIHARGIVHRDVKPGNILIDGDGNARLSDMGIARMTDSTTRTQTGAFLGSLAYAAPETFRGEADERSDLYALGVVLYEMLTGTPPFDGDPARMMDQHRRAAPPGLDDLERRFGTLGALVGGLMEKQPQDRPQSAAEVVASLRTNAGERTTIVMPPAGRRRERTRALSPMMLIAGAAAAAVVVLIVVMAVLSSGSPGDDAVASDAVTPEADGTATSVAAYARAVSTSEARVSATAAANAFVVAAATAQAPAPTPAPPSGTAPVSQPPAAPPPSQPPPAPPPASAGGGSMTGTWEVLLTLTATDGGMPIGTVVKRTFSIDEDCRTTPCFLGIESYFEGYGWTDLTGTRSGAGMTINGTWTTKLACHLNAFPINAQITASVVQTGSAGATQFAGTAVETGVNRADGCAPSSSTYEISGFRSE